MKYLKITMNNWFKDSFHCSYENVEYDENAHIWMRPGDVIEMYGREVGYYETNTI